MIDDVFTDLVRDVNGRATMKLIYNGKELQSIPPGGSWEERFWITTKGY